MVSFVVSFFYLACLLVPQTVTTFELSLYENGEQVSFIVIRQDEQTWLAQNESEKITLKINENELVMTGIGTIDISNFLKLNHNINWQLEKVIAISPNWEEIEPPIVIERGRQQILLKQQDHEKPVIIRWKDSEN